MRYRHLDRARAAAHAKRGYSCQGIRSLAFVRVLKPAGIQSDFGESSKRRAEEEGSEIGHCQTLTRRPHAQMTVRRSARGKNRACVAA